MCQITYACWSKWWGFWMIDWCSLFVSHSTEDYHLLRKYLFKHWSPLTTIKDSIHTRDRNTKVNDIRYTRGEWKKGWPIKSIKISILSIGNWIALIKRAAVSLIRSLHFVLLIIDEIRSNLCSFEVLCDFKRVNERKIFVYLYRSEGERERGRRAQGFSLKPHASTYERWWRITTIITILY